MKLFFRLLLAIAAIAAAVPKPLTDHAAPSTFSSELLEINLPSSIGTADYDHDFFDYNFTMFESCKSGVIYPTGTWSHNQYATNFTLDSSTYVYVMVNGKPLTMLYDFSKHETKYAYGDCQWGSNPSSSHTCGICVDGYWQAPELKCGQGDTATRYRTNRCFMVVPEVSRTPMDQPKVFLPRGLIASVESYTTVPSDVPLLFDVTVDPAIPTHGDLSDPQPGFWDYNLTILEAFSDGSIEANAQFTARGVSTVFFFDQTEESFVWAKINDKYLQISYDYKNHWANFAYDDSHWGMDIYSARGRGFCDDNGGWSRAQLEFPKDKLQVRAINLVCWIYLGVLPTGGAGEELKHTTARNTAPQGSNNTSSVAIATQSLTSPHTATTNGRIAYYAFSLSVTEYCEASEGVPLKARGWWSNSDMSSGVRVEFADGATATQFNLGYSDQLLVGPYDYYEHRVGFHYGNCHWDQDNDGKDSCGYCISKPWTSAELNCAANAAAIRNHGIDCLVAVQYEASAQNQPKPIAARANEPQVTPTATVLSTPATILASTSNNFTILTTTLLFHFRVTEQCENGAKKATGLYTSGGINQEVTLWPGLIIGLVHLVPNFPPLYIGPFDYASSRLRYSYNDLPISCEWYDDETWKVCAECRAALWSGPPVDCAGGGGYRTKDMDCSLILG